MNTVSYDALCVILRHLNQEELVYEVTSVCKKLRDCIYSRPDAWNHCMLIPKTNARPSFNYLMRLPLTGIKTIYFSTEQVSIWLHMLKIRNIRLDCLVLNTMPTPQMGILRTLTIDNLYILEEQSGFSYLADSRISKRNILQVNNTADMTFILASNAESVHVKYMTTLRSDQIESIKPTLKSLKLSYLSQGLRPDTFRGLRLTSLVELRIDNMYAGRNEDLIISNQFADIAACQTLRILELTYVDVYDEDICKLGPLTTLKLNMATITLSGMTHISLMPLEELALTSIYRLTDADLVPLGSMKTLRILNLTGCNHLTESCKETLSKIPLTSLIMVHLSSVDDQETKDDQDELDDEEAREAKDHIWKTAMSFHMRDEICQTCQMRHPIREKHIQDIFDVMHLSPSMREEPAGICSLLSDIG